MRKFQSLILLIGSLCFVGWADAAPITITPTSLVIVIPAGQVSAPGSITATNVGTTASTITWVDALTCLQGLASVTRTLAAGASTTFTINGVCPQTGSATLTGTGINLLFPVTITTAAPTGGLPGVPSIRVTTVGVATLTWNANGELDLAGYRVYQRTGATYGAAIADVGKLLTYRASGLTQGTPYFFTVTAYDQTGNESPKSNEVTLTP